MATRTLLFTIAYDEKVTTDPYWWFWPEILESNVQSSSDPILSYNIEKYDDARSSHNWPPPQDTNILGYFEDREWAVCRFDSEEDAWILIHVNPQDIGARRHKNEGPIRWMKLPN